MLLSFTVFLSEVLDIPQYLLGAPQTPINWRETLFLILLIIFVGIFTTITIRRFVSERKQTERVLQKSQQEFISLFNSSAEALAYQEEKGNILNINPRFTELFGYNLNEVKGRNIDDGMIHPPEKMEEGKRMTEKALKGRLYYETIRKKKDGTLFPVYISGSKVMLEGKLQGTIVMYRDITERKQDEQLHQVLYNISKAANSPISLNKLYKTIHKELSNVLDTTNFYIALVDEKENNIPFLKLGSNNTPTTHVIRMGQSFLINKKQSGFDF